MGAVTINLFESITTHVDFQMAKIIDDYNRKRDFVRTPEPRGTAKQSRVDNKGRFVVQKHDATADLQCKSMMRPDYIMTLDLKTKKKEY